MSFLKLIGNIVKRRGKSGSEEKPDDPAEHTAAAELATEPERVKHSGSAGEPKPSPEQERLDRFETLTPREREVYEHLIRGLRMREIAELLSVTYPTVNFHCKGLYKKLGINTRAQLFMQYAPLDAGGAKNKEEKT